MTDTSVSVDHAGAEAAWPTEGEKLPSFLSGDRSDTERAVRDFRLGHVVNQSLSILRRQLLPFLLLCGISSLLLNVPVAFTNTESPDVDVAIACVISLVLFMLFNVFSGAVVIDAAIDDMRARPSDMTKAMRVALYRFFPVLGVTLAVVVLAILGLPFIFVPTAIVISVYFVAVPACVVEGLGPLQSMRRSAELTKGYRWRICVLWCAVWSIEAFVQARLDQITRLLGNNALILAPQIAWDVFVVAFAVVATAVTYRDLRVAKEGVDGDQIATVFD